MATFISFEGGDGSGKSTHARTLANRLTLEGLDVKLVREPGSTPLGQYLRKWLKQERDTDDISPTTELLLFSAARAELVEKVVVPALEKDTTVISDRFIGSTLAYQGYGRGLSINTINKINKASTGGLIPDLTILLDCPIEVGLARGNDGLGQRRFEEESLHFHERVRRGYLELANIHSDRWHTIDSTLSIPKIEELVWAIVTPHLTAS